MRSAIAASFVVVITRTLFDAILLTGFAFQQPLTVTDNGLDASMVKITADYVGYNYREGMVTLIIGGGTVEIALDHVLAVY